MSERLAVVTGGTGGLGSALVLELSSFAWKVDAPLRSDFDLNDVKQVSRFFDNKKPELLVCAAGITRDALLTRMSEADWDETWAVNFTGAAICANAVLPGMTERGLGHVVFISSWSALHPPPGQAAYAASKSAILGLVKDLAKIHGPSNIRINAVLPGFLETRMTSQLSRVRHEEIRGDHVLGRFNTCSHVASFIRILHENLPHTSGQVFQLDSRIS